MCTQCEMKAKENSTRAFWDQKARKYPSPFDTKTIGATSTIIALVKGRGVEIEYKRVLDIGCGTGIYTLPLAKKAVHVTGVDFSDGMLHRLQKEMSLHHINNVDIIKSTWSDLNVEARQFAKSFDVAWSAMSPAINDRAAISKMEHCSKLWCVYIGWGTIRKNALMEEAFRLHGLNYGPPPGAHKMCGILKDMGRSCSLDMVKDSWDWEGTEDEAIEDIAGFISMQGATPRKEAIKELLSSQALNGLIKHTTFAEKGVVVWRAP